MYVNYYTKVSDFFCGMSGEESIGFLNDWNASCDHREKIYISYDSTNKNSEAGNIEMVEFGEAKVDVGLPIFNYSIAYDTKNAKPLFYENYLGSIADISQLEFMLGKAKGYGYKNIGFMKVECQTAHCGRCKLHFDFGRNTSPIVPYRHLPQTLRGLTADCRSLV